MCLSGWKEKVDIIERQRRKRVIYQIKEIQLSKVPKQNLGGCVQNQSWNLAVCQWTRVFGISVLSVPKALFYEYAKACQHCVVHASPAFSPTFVSLCWKFSGFLLICSSDTPLLLRVPWPLCYWQLLALAQSTAWHHIFKVQREKENAEQTQSCSSYRPSPCSKDQFCSFLLNIH